MTGGSRQQPLQTPSLAPSFRSCRGTLCRLSLLLSRSLMRSLPQRLFWSPRLSICFAAVRSTKVLSPFSGSNEVVDRDTFVNMFDTEASPKEGAADLVFNLTTGGPPHKREFARVVTALKTAKIVAETKLQTDAVARAHGVPVTLLPCDWTSIMTEFKTKSAITLPTIDYQPNRCLRISPRSELTVH